MGEKIRTHDELEVYRLGMGAAMQIFQLSKSSPKQRPMR